MSLQKGLMPLFFMSRVIARLRNQRRLGPPSASLVCTTSDGSSQGMRNDTLKFLGDNLVPVFARLSITAFLFGQGVSRLYPLESIILTNPPSSFVSIQEARLSLVDLINLSLMFVRLSTPKKHGNGITQDGIVRFLQLKECLVKWLQVFERVEQSDPFATHRTIVLGICRCRGLLIFRFRGHTIVCAFNAKQYEGQCLPSPHSKHVLAEVQ